MAGIAESTLRFTWAQPIFGAQQLLNAFSPRRPGQLVGKAATAFDAVSLVAGEQLGDSLKGVFRLGDVVQRGGVDAGFDLLAGRVPGPEVLLRRTSDALRQARDVVRFLATRPDVGLAWQEFQEKLQVFQWVRNVQALLRLPADRRHVPLADLVARAYALGPFPALWAVEGAGHYYAASAWPRGAADPRNLLTDARAAAPHKSLTMLHAGVGLAFAERLLEGVTPTTPGPAVRPVLRRFLALCRGNSRPGYVGAALESLGLVARVFHPQELVPVIDRELAPLDEEALAFFWHGVGRALYFSPTYFLPFGPSPWRAVERDTGEVPHELGRLNATAGLAWAVTLVNMRRPRILEAVVRRYARELSRDGAFANGVSSSIVMRHDTTPDAPFVRAFCGHRPDRSDPAVAAGWDRLVRQPCEGALGYDHPALKAQGRLGEVFRFRPPREPDGRVVPA